MPVLTHKKIAAEIASAKLEGLFAPFDLNRFKPRVIAVDSW
jgi:hypothetical protein